jgi:hypothetical protein
MTATVPPTVRSLGVLSLGETGKAYALRREELLRLAGGLPEQHRVLVANYLRGGAIVFAAMEHTKDIIDGSFETPGGSGIMTDGHYYWRRDCADYVEHYGVDLPAEFVEHVQQLDWMAPEVGPERVLAIDRYLMDRGSRR